MASELEFFLFRDTYREARAKGYRELRTAGDYVEDYHILSSTFAEPVIGAIRRGADASAIPVEFSKGEWGPGQHEINLRYAEALEMADRHVLYKTAAKEIAASQGHSLTFMAKWHERHAGSSCHVHMSLWDADERPVFATGREASPMFRHFLGGLLAPRARAGVVLRADGQLVQALQRGHLRAHAHHLERRQPHGGIPRRGRGPVAARRMPHPRAPTRIRISPMRRCSRRASTASSANSIPVRRSRATPIAAPNCRACRTRWPTRSASWSSSAFARDAFGDAVVDHLLHFARTELASFEAVVTDFERARYFERI